jgi:hypothetical protein
VFIDVVSLHVGSPEKPTLNTETLQSSTIHNERIDEIIHARKEFDDEEQQLAQLSQQMVAPVILANVFSHFNRFWLTISSSYRLENENRT